MSTITGATAAANSQAASALSVDGANTTADSVLTDYDDFLTLLTAELKNQDPLNPQDSSEWIAQLASFSAVEQQMNMNAKLDELISATTASDVNQLGDWLGAEVSAAGVGVAFDGDTMLIPTPADENADAAQVLVRDSSGAIVATIDASPQGGDLTWNGRMDDGGQAAAGVYAYEFVFSRATDAGPETWTNYPVNYATVVEARIGDNGVNLVLDTGQAVDASAVSGVRQQSGAAPDDDGGIVDTAVDTVTDAVDAVVETVTDVVT